LDLSKAFDSVPHERLLPKLNQYGIDDPLLLWFRHFLTNRQQRVGIRGTYSNWSAVTSGVPQRTILGPILFLIYINDIPNIVNSSVKLFADDTKINRELIDDSDTSALQLDLDSLEEWARNWQVKFNLEKCEVMRISYKQDKSNHKYDLSNAILKCVNSYKDLHTGNYVKRFILVKSPGRFSKQSKQSAGFAEAYNWKQEQRNLLSTL